MKKLIGILTLVLVLNLLLVSGAAAEEEAFTLEEVVVTASKHPEQLSDTPVSVEVIDEEDISKKNAHNVADLLKDVGSVQINNHGGIAGQKTISVRGSDASQVLILIDGQPINSSQNGQVDLSQLSTEQIEKIEVLRGPTSAIYGANALGGVVNIITKTGSQQPETSLKVGYGSFNTQKYNLAQQGSTAKLDYNLAVTKKKSDGHREKPENSHLNQTNLFTKFNYQLSSYSDLILSLTYDDSKKGIPGSTSMPSPEKTQDDQKTNFNLQWKRQAENNDLKLIVYHNQHKQVIEASTGDDEHKTKRTGLEFDQTVYSSAHTVTYGGSLQKNKVDSTRNGEHDTLNKALFVQDKWQIRKPLIVRIGGRYDNHEIYGSEFSPRAGAVYKFTSNLNAYVSAGKAYRAPTFNELYWDQPAQAMIGNPSLEPETAVAYESGVKYAEEKCTGKLSLFQKDVEDMINWEFNKEGNFMYKPYNVKTVKISGAELTVNKDLTDNLAAKFNYTYLDVRNKDSEELLAYKPYHKANLNLEYQTQTIMTNLNSKFVGRRKASSFDNHEELPNYFLVDLKTTKQVTDNIEVALEANNLLNKDYQIRDGYPMPGRNYMIELSTKF